MREKFTDQELYTIASEIFSGHIFTSWGLSKEETEMVFLPLLFMTPEVLDELIASEPATFFGYMKDAVSLGVNGMPIFWSMSFLTKSETKVVSRILTKLQKEDLWNRQTWKQRLLTLVGNTRSSVTSFLSKLGLKTSSFPQ